MDSPTYIKNAIRTESVPETINIHQVALASILGIGVLAGKLVDLAKKRVFYGKAIDPAHVAGLCAALAEGTSMLGQAVMTEEDINMPVSLDILDMGDGFAEHFKQLNIRALHASMGCYTESGELLEAMVKQLTDGDFDKVNFGEEIGDIEWYQAIGFDATGVTEAECREKNIAKLRKRYPEKFDADQAINRDLDAERKTLED